MSNAKPTDHTDNLTRLLQIMARLRDPLHGCAWDKRQTMQSLTRYTIEEAYEVATAIAEQEPAAVRDELGDLLFQVVFYCQIAQERGEFDFYAVAGTIADKLERRHPHLFADPPLAAEDPRAQWQFIKAQEQAEQRAGNSVFDGVNDGLPALLYAQHLQQRCAEVGFDWPEVAPVMDKVREEVDEISAELDHIRPDPARISEEIGDALFALVNLARHCQVDADTALRQASVKFRQRFQGIEELAGQHLGELELDELEALWQQVKETEKAAP